MKKKTIKKKNNACEFRNNNARFHNKDLIKITKAVINAKKTLFQIKKKNTILTERDINHINHLIWLNKEYRKVFPTKYANILKYLEKRDKKNLHILFNLSKDMLKQIKALEKIMELKTRTFTKIKVLEKKFELKTKTFMTKDCVFRLNSTFKELDRFILFFDLITEGISLEDQLISRKEVLDLQSKDLVKSNVRFINEGKDLELSGDYIILFRYCFHLQNRILDDGQYFTSGPYGSFQNISGIIVNFLPFLMKFLKSIIQKIVFYK
jgi:hypothetical protein